MNPYGPCHHTKYEGCPPCVHSAWEKGVQAARDAVAALPVALTVVHDTPFLNKQGMSVCENPDKYPHGIVQVAALAAIDALRADFLAASQEPAYDGQWYRDLYGGEP